MSNLELVSSGFLLLAGFGVLVQLVIALMLIRHRRRPLPVATRRPGMSILKPLAGGDDDLAENLASFAAMEYAGPWEVLLGVHDAQDDAFPIAQAAAARWPERFRLHVQEDEPGLNPKVNQLITLQRHAAHEVLVVSDSNVRILPGYLEEIAAFITQPDVSCVTHPVIGQGEESLGSTMDNTHLATSVAAGQVSAMEASGKPLVVGKSMAFWREDLERLGGFMAVKDCLAEDFVFGWRVRYELKKHVVMGRMPVAGYSRRKSVADFRRRYERWGVVHRTSISVTTSLSQGLLQPWSFAALALLISPSQRTLAALVAVVLLKLGVDLFFLHFFRPTRVTLKLLGALVLKDVIVQWCWFRGFFVRTVTWRGNKLRVGMQSRLLPMEPEAAIAPSAVAP